MVACLGPLLIKVQIDGLSRQSVAYQVSMYCYFTFSYEPITEKSRLSTMANMATMIIS